MTTLKFAIVGVGNRGRALARAALATGDVDVVAFADPDAAARAAAAQLLPDARAYDQNEQLIAQPGLDALLVATPNYQHTTVTIAALEAGLHVLCEKPLAPTLDECARIARAAASSGRIFQVGLELRHAPMFRAFHDLVADGRIGPPKLLWCHEFRPPFKPGVGNWRLAHGSSGGTLVEKNCHHFDLFNWLSGARPTRVMAMGSNDTIYVNADILDRAWVLVEYANGVQASLGLGLFFDREEHLELGALGPAGKLTCTIPEDRVVLDTPGGRAVREFTQVRTETGGFAHGGEIEQQRAFIQSIRTGEPPLTDAKAAFWSQSVSLAAEAAVRSRQPVSIGPDGHLD